MTIVDVTKFGAVPNDGKTDSKAVMAALEECKKQTPAALLFPNGKYHFSVNDRTAGASPPFAAVKVENLTIDGQGSEFAMDGITGFFAFAECKNIPVGAFMDYDPKTLLPMRHGLDEYYTGESTELLQPQVLRVHLKHQD